MNISGFDNSQIYWLSYGFPPQFFDMKPNSMRMVEIEACLDILSLRKNVLIG